MYILFCKCIYTYVHGMYQVCTFQGINVYVHRSEGSLVELVEQQPATRRVVGSIPAGSALEVWPWTSVLNSLVG